MADSFGPFETEDQVRALVEVRAVYDAAHVSNRPGVMTEMNTAMLLGACEGAGVDLGAYDQRILSWFAQWEPQTVAVVADIIRRAAERQRRPAGVACTCEPGWCSRGEFRDHQGDSSGCMACADLDPDQPCLADRPA